MEPVFLIPRYNKHLFYDLSLYKHWLMLETCTYIKNKCGIICPDISSLKILFSKKIKLFCNYMQHIFLVTEDAEYYFWHGGHICEGCILYDSEGHSHIPPIIHYCSHNFDWSNIRIKKCAVNYCSFLVLTDNGKIYYSDKKKIGMDQMKIKKKITCFGCGYNFYIIVTDDDRTYTWGIDIGSLISYFSWKSIYSRKLLEVTKLSGKTIVKVACGYSHTLVLTDKGEVYAWGSNKYRQSDFSSILRVVSSPVLVNDLFTVEEKILNVKKLSDIAAIRNMSIVKSSDGLIYIWGSLFGPILHVNNFAICEYTNILDISNTMTGQSSISKDVIFTDEETSILNDLTDLFNDRSTSDFTIKVKDRSIYVHKAILKIRSLYFKGLFKGIYFKGTFDSCIENNQCINCCHYSYVVYVTFLRYLYTGMIDQSAMSSMKDLLELLTLANTYCEKNLESDCIWMIRKRITVANFLFVINAAVENDIKELKEYCLNFFIKHVTAVKKQESFVTLNSDIKEMLKTKHNQYLQQFGSNLRYRYL